MHEWSLAEAVVATAVRVAEKEGLKEIIEIKIKLGELQQIEKEIFEFALKEITKQESPLLNRTGIEIEMEKAILKCRVCGKEWSFSDATKEISGDEAEFIHFLPDVAHVYIGCPKCKSPDFEIIQGRGVWIDSIEGK
ncbi:MAG: hydrogenase nickel incorporation protein HypA [candidate division WOR-3 bacterium]|nr:hydrogenase nickel incorporation protein HypA [candidate division WOR-3 bacterium]